MNKAEAARRPLRLSAQPGEKLVALIEQNKVGGVCLNRGCIPTKRFILRVIPGVEERAAAGVLCDGSA